MKKIDKLYKKLNRRFGNYFHPYKVGKFKIETQVKKGIVLAHGVYSLKTIDGREIVKYQGVPNELRSLKTFEDFEKVKSLDKKK